VHVQAQTDTQSCCQTSSQASQTFSSTSTSM